MEDHRQKNSSVDMFSSPSSPNPDQELEFEFEFKFEFGAVKPSSPFNDPNKNSPADDLFFNGRLLPHAFPIQKPTNIGSRTSSVSSKDSLMSSRSNSSNSRSSSCSSARTSSSDNSERKLLYPTKVEGKTPVLRDIYKVNRSLSTQPYGYSQRWQLITQVPVLNPELSRRKKAEHLVQEELRPKKQAEKRSGASLGFGRRFLRSVLSACRECHAIQPSTKDDVLRQKTKLQ